MASEVAVELERGREAYAQSRWLDAFEALSLADERQSLDAADLELFASAAALVGRVDVQQAALERVHRLHVEAARFEPAAKAAVTLGMTLAVAGEVGPAMGWFGRAERLIDQAGEDSIVYGYLQLPVVFQRLATSDLDGAYAAASQAAAIARRFGEEDLFATATQAAGTALIKQGRTDEGLRLLDEAMVGVTAGDVTPFLAGVVYCGVIASCEEAFEVGRAQQWTNALTRWCESQPQLVSFTGRCLAHRAGLKQLHGAWADALEEARLARERCEEAMNRAATGQAYYQQGELHRLRGEYEAAEAAYRDASRCGREPQPGLALLRLAQADVEAASTGLSRALAERTEPLQRAVLLPAHAEVLLARGDVEGAGAAADELDEIARSHGRPMLLGVAAYVRGAVEIAREEPRTALPALRRATQVWDELDAPYELARTRVLVAIACRSLTDEEGARLELESARATFEQLGAAPDVARVDGLTGRDEATTRHGLTARELEVLRLVASGKTNRQIATQLVVSEHTVARHVQNIFGKLGVSSRTAASAYAFEHHLV
jgi:DNA-binding CsgD family transcriptional regulator